MQHQYSTIMHQYSDEQGNFYCRAVHGILNERLDQQVCGKGCPCCCIHNEEGEVKCTFLEDIYTRNVDIPVNNAKRLWIMVEDEIENGATTLFPLSEAYRLSPLIAKAFEYASTAHRGQCRKGTGIPYFTHIITTLNYAIQLTDEEEILAGAILHDTVEDTWVTVADIEKEFGPRIASFVAAETENKRADKPAHDTWEIRKQENINHLINAPYEVKLITLSDKTANAESMLREWKQKGDDIWKKFNQHDKNKHAWYYYSCKEALREFDDTTVMKIYGEILDELFSV